MRLAVQQAVMIEGYMGHLPDSCKWNVDASTMIIEDQGKNSIMCRVVSCRQADEWQDELMKNPLSSIRFQQGLDIALKWMHLSNGNGDFGKMVLVVAVPGMPDGRFHAVQVQGLVFGADNTLTGWLYFAKTRCMKGLPPASSATVTNSESSSSTQDASMGEQDEEAAELISNAWSHYFKNVFLSDITRYSDAYDLIDPETSERYENVCTIDGENCVNRELLDPSIWTALSEANIKVVKNRPSGTAYDNANDAADNFRDKNTGLAVCAKNNINTSNKFLEINMDRALEGLKVAFPDVTISASHWTKIKMGVSRFVHVCKSKYVTSGKAVIGFQRACQVRIPGSDLKRPILGRENSTVDAYRILKKLCFTKIEGTDMNNIMNHFPEMLAEQKSMGRVDNKIMDRLEICCLPEGDFKNRDEKCLAQQGPIELTHPETRARQAAYAARKETAARQKELADAVAFVAAHEEKERKMAATALERNRIAKLSPEEKSIDPACVEQRRVAKEKSERAKSADLQRKDQLKRARELISGGS